MSATIQTVLAEIIAERERQIAKWGEGQALTPMEYLAIIGEEYGEVCRAVHDAYFAAQYPGQALPQWRFIAQMFN